MNEKPIIFDLIPLDHRESAEFFLCSFTNSHLVEDPIVCQQPNCQRMMCKSCYSSFGACPNCGSMIDLKTSQLPEDFLQMLNPIPLNCENTKNGCMAKVQYESYRRHTRNCQFKISATPTPFPNESKKFAIKIETLPEKDDFEEKKYSPSSAENHSESIKKENKFQNFSYPYANINLPNTLATNYLSDNTQTLEKNKQINDSSNSYSNLSRAKAISSESPLTKNLFGYQQNQECQPKYFSMPDANMSASKTIFQEKKDKPSKTNEFCDNLQKDKEHQKSVSIPCSNTSPKQNVSSEKIAKNDFYETFTNDNKIQSKTFSKTCSNPWQTDKFLAVEKEAKKEENQKKKQKPLFLEEERKEKNQSSSNQKPLEKKKSEIKNEDLFNFNERDYESLTETQLIKILGYRKILKEGNKEELIKILKFYVGNLKANLKKKELFSTDKNDLSDEQLRQLKPEDFKDFTIENLRALLSKRNVPKAGNKDDLILKLRCILLIEEKPDKNKNELLEKSKKIKKKKLKNKSVDELKNMLKQKDLSEKKKQLINRILEEKQHKI